MPSRYDTLRDHLRATPRDWLLTGVAGFIGSHLLDALLELGQRVVGVDDFSTGRRSNLDAVRAAHPDAYDDAFRFVEGSICDLTLCRELCSTIQLVSHQAALGSVPRSIEFPADTHAANVDGTANLFIAAAEAKVEGFGYASSSSVYGDSPTLPKIETEIGNPLSPYAASKRIAEIYADVWHRVYRLPVVGLRYFNVVGPRQDPEGPYAAVVPRWLTALATGRPATIYGDGETSRDFCPIDNVIQANLLAACAPASAHGKAFNVALGQQTTLNELFALLRDGLASRGLPCGDAQPRYEDFRAGDIRHSLADISAAQSLLGYAPHVDLASGLAAAMDAQVQATPATGP